MTGRAEAPADVVRAYRSRVDARDWRCLADLLADDVVVDWPVSAERIVGAAHVVAVNAEYPEGWSIRVLSVLADGDRVASEVEVPMAGVGVFRVASFWTVRGGRIVAGTEYWTALGADEAPAWRQRYSRPLDGDPAPGGG